MPHRESFAEIGLRERLLPLADVARLVRLAARALDELHASGHVHGGPSSAHLFLVRGAEQDRVEICPGVGAAEYLAPELAGRGRAGPPADVYALAVVTYELLCGQRPFESPNRDRVLFLKQHRDAPTMLERASIRFPEPVEDAVARGLARDPARRPASAGGLADQLERAACADLGQRSSSAAAAALEPRAPGF